MKHKTTSQPVTMTWPDRTGRLASLPFRRLRLRAGILAVAVASLLALTPRQVAQSGCDLPRPADCAGNRQTKMIFLLDRSGSMALRGGVYNSQIDAVLRSLRDPTVIPRDGSVEVGVILFGEAPNVIAVAGSPLTRIDSAAAAEAVAKAVEAARCANLSSQVFPCPAGATSFEGAVLAADILASQNGVKDAHRLFVMSTDGQTSEEDAARAACRVRAARNAAVSQGLTFEFDAILVGLDPADAEFAANKARVDRLVIAQDVPPNCNPNFGDGVPVTTEGVSVGVETQDVDTLPGATLVVNGGACLASPTADCRQQVNEFAGHIRAILRQGITPLNLVVNTTSDTNPGAPVAEGALSLRQALERANCRGGDTTISFSESIHEGTIRPRLPLPAITSPGITINGCTGEDCTPAITIDGNDTDASAGEGHGDGLLIRSYQTTVRGLRIVGFERAGIAVDPICPQDVALDNLIERNELHFNLFAGVLINDPDAKTARAIEHSTGNTVTRNAISNSTILIDLGGDGATANDSGDGDAGPNTLLNFPDEISVVANEDGTVTVSGKVNGPAAAGATVEIFGATLAGVGADDLLKINGVEFLGVATADADGVFVASGLPPAVLGVYTATVTDGEGNTSELMFDSDVTPAQPSATVTEVVNFGDVTVGSASTPRQILITNTGNAPLLLTEACSLVQCTAGDPNNTARFALTGCPTTAINPGATVTVTVVFTPNACGAVRACARFATNDPFDQILTTQLNGTGNATGQGRLILEGGGSTLDFGTVTAKANGLKAKKQPKRTFTVENTGCQPLTVTIGNIVRTGADTTNGKITNTNDSKFFTVVALSSSGVESPISGPVVVAPRESRSFRVKFNPSIPAVLSQTSGLAAADVLPDVVTSQVQLTQAGGAPLAVNLVGRVTTDVKLINPANPALDPVVTLVRSGDDFIVEFSVFDSDLNVNRVSYQFFDRQGRSVGQTFDIDVMQQIRDRNLVRGQSFTISQKFSGARDNDDVVRVQIVVTDGGTSIRATGVITSSLALSSFQKREQSSSSSPASDPLAQLMSRGDLGRVFAGSGKENR